MSRRCGTCGNVIQEWHNGVCQTCARNEKDIQRYGRRRPAVKRKSRTYTRKQERPVRRKKPASSRSTRASSPMALRSRPAPRPGKPARREIPQWRREQSKGINRLLRDVYGQGTLVSKILRRHGIPARAIVVVSKSYRWEFNDRFVENWRRWCKKHGKAFSRNFAVLEHLYGLHPLSQLSELATARRLGLTPKQVALYRRNGIRLLRTKKLQWEFEQLFVRAAKRIDVVHHL